MNIRDITFENHFSPNFSRVDIGITLHSIESLLVLITMK